MAKKKPFDSLYELSDHFDQIRSTNGNLTEQQILEIVGKATGQTLSNIKKRWRLMLAVDWPVLDYIERGIIGMNRAMCLLDFDLTRAERTKVMEDSLNENISDAAFKDYLTRFVEKKEASAS